MKKVFLLIFLWHHAISIVEAQSLVFPVDTVHFSGEPQNRLDIVFVSEGYLADSLNQFIEDVNTIVETMHVTSPFKEYMDFINIIAIRVPSNEEGAASRRDDPIDNFFGSYFSPGGLINIERQNLATTISLRNYPRRDQTYVLINEQSRSAGLAYFGQKLAMGTNVFSFGQLAIHELGHSVGHLGDEYWTGGFQIERANITATRTEEFVKWRNWLIEPSIGLFSLNPSDRTGVWRKPARVCKMLASNAPFCFVCQETMVESFYDYAKPIDQYQPESYSGSDDMLPFQYTPLAPEPNTLKSFWILNGDTVSHNSSLLNIPNSSLSNDTHELSLNIVDTTSMSRKDELTMYSINWTVNKNSSGSINITSQRSQTAVDRAELYDFNWILEEEQHDTNVIIQSFPNPFTDQLTISFNNPITNFFELQILDLSGQVFQTERTLRLPVGDYRYEINTSALTKGLFFVKIRLGEQVFLRKVIK